MPRLQVGERLPAWEATTIDGRLIGSDTLRGRPAVIVLLRGLG
ncbi:MAG: hypothetical protein RMH81_06800 [Thermomicrobium sp.]|nr:hypothetical protein [Thermomicrobium sp.]